MLAVNAEAARQAVRQEPSDDEAPAAGFRTVSLPIGSIGADPAGATRPLEREAVTGSAQDISILINVKHTYDGNNFASIYHSKFFICLFIYCLLILFKSNSFEK